MNDVGERIYNLLLDCGIDKSIQDFGKYHGENGVLMLMYEIFWMLEEIFGEDEE